MDNQHRQINGYRELGAEEVALMNEIKQKAQDVGELLDRLQSMSASKVDHRAAAIARTELQTGFMWAVRAIARPTTF